MSCELNFSILGITGDCSNSSLGGFEISITGTAPNYSVEWITPAYGTIPLGTATTYSVTGLSSDTYTFYIFDSCPGGNTETSPYSIYISSGTCVTLSEVESTFCGYENGSITAQTQNLYGLATFELYENISGLVNIKTSEVNTVVFNNLAPGIYYVVADDGGGCTGKTQSCIVKSSSTFTFGFYSVPNAGCGVDSGSIYITGLTGTPPYTYLWSNGNTTQSITGLSEGSYSVIVTDSSGCESTNGITLSKVDPLGVVSLTTSNPNCFSSDGEVTVYVTGGTAPYYYSGSNGSTIISFDSSNTFTGLSSGFFSVTVTDAGLCQFTSTTQLLTPNAISIVTVNTTNSTCNNNGGGFNVSIFGGAAPYVYTLTDALSNTTTIVQPVQNGGAIFNGLSSGTYLLTITDSLGICPYSQYYSINNTVLFNLTTSTTGTTCGEDNGSVTLDITTGGTGPYNFEINGQSVISNSLSYTFTNLPAGNYTASVTDVNLCQQIIPFTINTSNGVNFILNGTSPIGNNGIIQTFITSGEPPFTLNWSPNVGGQTGLTVTNLSAGTYSLTVTDSSGCTQYRTISLVGYNLFSSYEVYNICNDDFTNTGQLVKKGLKQMLVEGFFDLTSGDTNCILNSATFEVIVSVDGVQQSVGFYVSTGLNDFPTDSVFYDVVKLLLLTYPNIETVTIDPVNGDLKVSTFCNPPVSIMDATVTVDVKISYDISCVSCS
jgi:uncharacterized protein (DUF2141 family)